MNASARALTAAAFVAATAIAGWLVASPDHSTTDAHLQPAPALQTPATHDVIATSRAPETSGQPASPAAPQIVLTGVVAGTGGGNLAIASVDLGPEMLVRVGDRLGPATVVRIDDASMTYRLAGNERRVSVQTLPAATATAMPVAAPKPPPGFTAAAPAMARAEGSEPGSGNAAFRQAVEKKIQSIVQGR